MFPQSVSSGVTTLKSHVLEVTVLVVTVVVVAVVLVEDVPVTPSIDTLWCKLLYSGFETYFARSA